MVAPDEGRPDGPVTDELPLLHAAAASATRPTITVRAYDVNLTIVPPPWETSAAPAGPRDVGARRGRPGEDRTAATYPPDRPRPAPPPDPGLPGSVERPPVEPTCS